jgi:hypothetical protein
VKRLKCLALLSLLPCFFITPTGGAPVRVEPAKEYPLIGLGQINETFKLKGQEPARVVASALKDPTARLGLYVFDADGNCVAWNDTGSTPNTVGVVFVPPAEGAYLVQVRNFTTYFTPVRLEVH